jgi:UDPglucose 6-dehydrogenase
MGTTVYDFTHPEFVLFGMSDENTANLAESFYKTIHGAPFYRCSIKSAELVKVAYNTFISTKLAFVNNLMEVCHHTGADVDEVTSALKLATERLISPKYLNAGMGDGGGCHPRDNIALSWLSRKLGMTFDFHEAIMVAREKQTEFLANLVCQNRRITSDFVTLYGLPVFAELPVVILGKAFKEQTNLEVGSPSILLKNILAERGIKAEMYDPWVDNAADKTVNPYENSAPSLFFIGTHHAVFADYKFPNGSVIVDPWRMIKDQEGVKVIRVGENKTTN